MSKEKIKELYQQIRHFFKAKKIKERTFFTYNLVWNTFLTLFIFGIIGACFAGATVAGYFASLVEDTKILNAAEMTEKVETYEQTTRLYFADEIEIGNVRTDLERDVVTLDQISPYVINALISTEDEYFYEHDGVVPKAIMRAFFQEASNASIQTGGSTLTQQLIKNQILTNEVSHERKAKEILYSYRLENVLSKDEILEAYLNMAPFGRNSSGRNIAGIQTAAKGVFGVNADELNLPQAAYLTGLPQNPITFTPFTNTGTVKEDISRGVNRMKTVLQRMYSNHVITKDELDEALAYDIQKDFIPSKGSATEKYPWLVAEIQSRALPLISNALIEQSDYTVKEVNEHEDLKSQFTELAKQALETGGYHIYTTIHKDIYEGMQEAKDSFAYYGPNKTYKGTEYQVETGAVLIENKTGAILGFVGGRNHSVSQVNHATVAKRQNGSTMKPLLGYAPAIEKGLIQPATMIDDTRTADIKPYNIGNVNHGWVSAREALKKSYNIPAVRIYKDLLHFDSLSYLNKMGFTSLVNEDIGNQSTVLGGLSIGVTVEENANAFSTFANGGNFIDAYLIDKIVDNNGNVIYQHEVASVPVFSPQTSYLVLDMMRDVISSGTAASLNGRLSFSDDWAGKTGTTNDDKDVWFVASNPNVTLGTWMGYDVGISLSSAYGISSSAQNIRLWASLMNSAYRAQPSRIDATTSFKQPQGIVSRSVCSESGLLATNGCAEGKVISELFNSKYTPTKSDSSKEDKAKREKEEQKKKEKEAQEKKEKEEQDKKAKEEQEKKEKEERDKKEKEEQEKKAKEEQEKKEKEERDKKEKEEQEKQKQQEQQPQEEQQDQQNP